MIRCTHLCDIETAPSRIQEKGDDGRQEDADEVTKDVILSVPNHFRLNSLQGWSKSQGNAWKRMPPTPSSS